jgi:hypothetical protein
MLATWLEGFLLILPAEQKVNIFYYLMVSLASYGNCYCANYIQFAGLVIWRE